jgi:hypothetical protein
MAGFDELWQQACAQKLERARIAKEAGFVDGHSFRNGPLKHRVFALSQALDKVLQVGDALVTQEPGEARIEKVVALRLKHVLRDSEYELPQIVVIDADG